MSRSARATYDLLVQEDVAAAAVDSRDAGQHRPFGRAIGEQADVTSCETLWHLCANTFAVWGPRRELPIRFAYRGRPSAYRRRSKSGRPRSASTGNNRTSQMQASSTQATGRGAAALSGFR